jgi:hypothetical protein
MKRLGSISVLFSALVLSGSLPAAGQATKDAPKPSAGSVTNAQVEGPRFFVFNGGSFNQFMDKLKEEFGKQVYDLIEIRSADAGRIRVPKMRIRISDDVRTVLFTYNRISNEGDGFLGKWIYSPSMISDSNRGQPPETIVFLEPKSGGGDGTGGIQVRAFSIRSMPQERLKALNEIIDKESGALQREIAERSGDASSAEGRVSIHEGTGLLVASGGKMYVELVGTLIDAFMTSREKFNAGGPYPFKN